MSIDIEKVKRDGETKALFDSTLESLWTGKMCLERARIFNEGVFMDFTASVDAAKKAIADAEATYYEHQRATGKL